MTTDKNIQPQDPDTTAEETDASIEADRTTSSIKFKGRKLGRKTMYGRH